MDTILENFTDFVTDLSFRDIPGTVATAAAEKLVDAVGCALGAQDGDIVRIGKAVASLPARSELGGRVLGSRDVVAGDAAAFVNSCMIRYLDFNDTYPGGHPSDTLGGLLAIGAQRRATGEELLTAMVVAYEVYIRLQMKAQFRERGWDQGGGIGVAAAAGLANLMKLSRKATRHALAITAVGNMPLRATRAGQLSMWKGAATAYAVRNAVFGVQLAAEGMTGPEAPFTGRHGLIEQVSGPIELPPFGATSAEFFLPQAKIKYWPVAYNLQSAVWAAVELRKQVGAEDLAEVDVQTYWSAWSESGSEPAKWDPRTQGTADHSLPYIMAWTLRHGQIDPTAFEPDSYLDPGIRPLMKTISVRVDDGIQADFPGVIRMRVNARDRAGKEYEVNVVNPLGHEENPISRTGLAEKFARLADPVLGAGRAAEAFRYWIDIERSADINEGFDLIDIPGGRDARKD